MNISHPPSYTHSPFPNRPTSISPNELFSSKNKKNVLCFPHCGCTFDFKDKIYSEAQTKCLDWYGRTNLPMQNCLVLVNYFLISKEHYQQPVLITALDFLWTQSGGPTTYERNYDRDASKSGWFLVRSSTNEAAAWSQVFSGHSYNVQYLYKNIVQLWWNLGVSISKIKRPQLCKVSLALHTTTNLCHHTLLYLQGIEDGAPIVFLDVNAAKRSFISCSILAE